MLILYVRLNVIQKMKVLRKGEEKLNVVLNNFVNFDAGIFNVPSHFSLFWLLWFSQHFSLLSCAYIVPHWTSPPLPFISIPLFRCINEKKTKIAVKSIIATLVETSVMYQKLAITSIFTYTIDVPQHVIMLLLNEKAHTAPTALTHIYEIP